MKTANPSWWAELRDYQLEAVDFIRSRGGTLLGDDLGGGKTRTALAAADYPALVMCRKSDIIVWEDECEYAGLSFRTLGGRTVDKTIFAEEARDVSVWIVPYSVAGRHVPYFSSLGDAPTVRTLIADEGHEMQKKATHAARAFRTLDWERSLILTATPIRNRLRSLWALLDALCYGSAWGGHWDWRISYLHATKSEHTLEDGQPTPEDLERLRKRLEPVLIKRTRAEMGVHVPPLTRHIESIDLPIETRKELVSMLGQVGAGELRVSGQKGDHLRRLTAFRQRVGLIKAGHLAKIWGWYSESWRRAIVWCWHKEVVDHCIEALKALGLKTFKITGGTSKKKRQEIVRRFRDGDLEPPRPEVLVASIGALSTGVSLTATGLAIFVEEDYAPLQMQQASKRTHRFAQRNDRCEEIYMTAAGTIDDRITRILVEKAEETERLLGVDGALDQMQSLLGRVEESTEDFMARIASNLKGEVR